MRSTEVEHSQHGRRAVPAGEVRRRWWLSSWRAALRLARRDALRHKGASILIAVMVGLPVLMITAASAFLATTEVTVGEALPVTLGNAQAQLQDYQSGPLTQNAEGEVLTNEQPKPGSEMLGHSPGELWTTRQLERLTGAAVAQVGYPDLYARVGPTLLRTQTLAMDTDALPTSGLATLVSGRWPQADDEVAVTETGTRAGLPAAGTLSLETGDAAARTVRVVGIASAVDPTYQPVGLVAGSPWVPRDTAGQFLLTRERPVTWDDVRAWNAQGLVVLSRAVLADPPAAARGDVSASGDAGAAALVVLVCLGLVLETTLLAGPAFAVSAARRRRSLTLVASNGADGDQLTRYVLAQAVVLGGGSVLLGCLLGTGAGWGTARLVDYWRPSVGRPPLDVYLGLTLLVAVAAVVASLVAAALPARGAARLALADTLRGQAEPRNPSRRLPLVGLALLGVGAVGVGLALASTSEQALYLAAVAGGVAMIGVLCCVPTLLRLLGTRLHRVPMALRMAARDASRARTRSTPAIAAVTVAVAVMTVASVSATSDDAQSRRDYQPRAVAGQGWIYAGGTEEADGRATLAEIRRQHPDWLIEPLGSVGSTYQGTGKATTLVAAVPPGCAAAETIAPVDENAPVSPCQALGSTYGAPIMARPLSTLDPDVRLTAEQRRTLVGGGLLVTSGRLVADGKVRLAVAISAPGAGSNRLVRELEVPATAVDLATLQAATFSQGSYEEGALMLPSAAERLKLPLDQGQWAVMDPSGPISEGDQELVNDRVVSGLEVERGFESPIALVVRVLLGLAAALVAVAALISTALAQSEARSDFATMSALGATAGFRRRLAGGQALLVSLTGTVLGLAVGLLPGVAMARSLTTEHYARYGNVGQLPGPPIVDVPWLPLAAVVIAVPLLAALVAALAVRQSPQLTRRLT